MSLIEPTTPLPRPPAENEAEPDKPSAAQLVDDLRLRIEQLKTADFEFGAAEYALRHATEARSKARAAYLRAKLDALKALPAAEDWTEPAE